MVSTATPVAMMESRFSSKLEGNASSTIRNNGRSPMKTRPAMLWWAAGITLPQAFLSLRWASGRTFRADFVVEIQRELHHVIPRHATMWFPGQTALLPSTTVSTVKPAFARMESPCTNFSSLPWTDTSLVFGVGRSASTGNWRVLVLCTTRQRRAFRQLAPGDERVGVRERPQTSCRFHLAAGGHHPLSPLVAWLFARSGQTVGCRPCIRQTSWTSELVTS